MEGVDSKAELWTWAQCLEETKAVAAPENLFQEVILTYFALSIDVVINPP